MSALRETQLRLEYTVLRLAIRVAAQLHLPMRTLGELARLSYVEVMRQSGARQQDIARRMGQTDRHLRSLNQRLRGDFFAAEQDPGLVREIESVVAAARPLARELAGLLPEASALDVEHCLKVLLEEQRVEKGKDGRLTTGPRFALLESPQFDRRLEELGQALEIVFRAIMQHSVRNDRPGAALEAVSFNADPKRVDDLLARLRAHIESEVRALEREREPTTGTFPVRRFSLALAASADDDEP